MMLIIFLFICIINIRSMVDEKNMDQMLMNLMKRVQHRFILLPLRSEHIVEFLLEQGADVDFKDDNEKIALYLATLNQWKYTVDVIKIPGYLTRILITSTVYFHCRVSFRTRR